MMKLLLGTAALLGAVCAQNSTELPTVDLGYEIYRASDFNVTGNFYNFSNIRYAAAPVGDLRFALPAPPKENRGTIQDGHVQRICNQASPKWGAEAVQTLTNSILGKALPNQTYVPPGATQDSPVPNPDPRETEDCLFLDVFVPEKVLSNKGKDCGAPVLVWIYGGGFTGGNKEQNPAGLLAASGDVGDGEVIYVAMNYRLGAFGFQSGPSFLADGGVSNLGLHDQRFALDWVQSNIHLFGGDKDKVTVFGESAGGGSIMHHITAYGGERGPAPFRAAIPQSPGWAPIQSNVQTEDTYQKFLKLTNATSLADLRAAPYETIRRANFQQIGYDSGYGTGTYSIVVDGFYVPQQPGQSLAQGKFDKSLRIMAGHNAHEGTYFTPPYINSDDDFSNVISTAYPYTPASTKNAIINQIYPAVFDGSHGYKTNEERAQLLVSEGVFTCNTNYLSKAPFNATYSYLFDVPPSFHGFDVAYTFYTGGAPTIPPGVTNTTIANLLQKYITNFAIHGEPSSDGVPFFNMYGPNASVLDLNITGIVEVRDSNANERCAWWQKALY